MTSQSFPLMLTFYFPKGKVLKGEQDQLLRWGSKLGS